MFFLIPGPQFTSFLFPACCPHPHPALGFSETKGQGTEKTDLRPFGGGDVRMCNNWELLPWDPAPLLRLWRGGEGGGWDTSWMWFILKEQGCNQPWKRSW